MIKKFLSFKLFNRVGVWSLPLVSVTSLLPILASHWWLGESSSEPEKTLPAVPSLSQLPSPSDSQGSLLASPPSGKSPSTLLKTPKQKTTTAKSPTPSTAKKTPEKKSPQAGAKLTSAASKKIYNPLLPAPPSYQPPKLEIKVAVLRDAPNTVLGTSTQASMMDRNGKVLQTLSANKGVWVRPNGSGLTVGNWQLPAVVWVQPTEGGLVYVGDRWYRGKMLLVSQGSSLLAVNYVDLEHYLYSVVGSEMHSTAPMAALKAQAIAARSYALVHMIRPASDWYHLGNTQRWQVYKGLGSEYNTSQHAVRATAGEILSYKGGVVESLYAATDEIVSRAHGGRGMSQTGAYELANKGYDYQQILSRYYPGVGLARLVLQ